MIREFLLSVACAVALAAPSFAQNALSPRAGSADLPPNVIAGGFSAEDLLDRDVETITGDEVGDVEDLLLSSDYSVKGVVVELGGFLGIGQRRVAIPIERLETNSENKFIVDLSKDELEALPALEKEHAVWVPD